MKGSSVAGNNKPDSSWLKNGATGSSGESSVRTFTRRGSYRIEQRKKRERDSSLPGELEDLG